MVPPTTRPPKERPPADTTVSPPDAADERAESDLVGQTVAGRYVVERLLGEGGIGRVWLARQNQLDRLVALKMLHPWLGHRREIAQRFEREARATSRINHPGCVTVFDFGTWNEQLYIAMEFIEGLSLADVLARDRRLSAAEVCDIGAQVCDVLAAAHALDLLHRDIKPENILLTRDADGSRRVKVVDFGLAFVLGEEETRLTREGTVAGTPAYMAPEQALNRKLDARADIYATGCVLYELLSGMQPFSGENSFEVLQRHIYDRAEPLARLVPGGLPPALERLVMQCLEKKRDLRPASADDLAQALRHVLDPDRPLRSSHVDLERSREQRAIPTTESAPRPDPAAPDPVAPATPRLAVWRSPTTLAFADTPQAALGAAGMECDVFDSIDTTLAHPVIIVDVRGMDATAARARLKDAVSHPAGAAVIAVGPDDDFQLMADALSLGTAEYLGPTALSNLPKRAARAARRPRRP